MASHPHRQAMSGYPMGEVLLAPASRVLALPGAKNEPEYARVLVVAAHQSVYDGDYDSGHDSAGRQPKPKQSSRRRSPAPASRWTYGSFRLPLCYGLAHTRKARLAMRRQLKSQTAKAIPASPPCCCRTA